ncbi:MAG: proline--tRNA ligase [Anaerolineaceae bacterium]|nr:proline--tRNA ligase [Anaerolineaceae bacterium]
MRMSQLFNLTLREAPGEPSTPGKQLLLRAGYIREMANGVFASLPLGRRSLQKLEHITRQELSNLGVQEVNLPALVPGEQVMDNFLDPESWQLNDTDRHSWSLNASSEPYLAELVKHLVRSHRNLPRVLFQIQTKFLNYSQFHSAYQSSRTVTRVEVFSLDKDNENAADQYRNLDRAFQNILLRCKLPIKAITLASNSINPYKGTEFFFLHTHGDANLIHCSYCDYWANQINASSFKSQSIPEPLNPLETVYTPNTKTIEDLSKFLNIPTSRTAKAVFMTATMRENEVEFDKVIMAIIRGDMELDQYKLARAIKAKKIRASTETEIQSIGAVPGFASPVGLTQGLIVVDDLIPNSYNLVAGANLVDYHLRNVNYARDYQSQIITDITVCKEGDPCPQCGHPLEMQHSYQIGKMNEPDHRLSLASGCNFQDENGELKPVIIGSAWFDLDRILACVAEEYHDQYGLILPLPIAPYQVHLVLLPSKNSNQPLEFADKLYQDLQNARIDVLYDDRKESPGIKFNDADLIGIPLRITVAEKSLSQGQVEFKIRHENEKSSVPVEDAVTTCMHSLLKLERDIAQAVSKNSFIKQ